MKSFAIIGSLVALLAWRDVIKAVREYLSVNSQVYAKSSVFLCGQKSALGHTMNKAMHAGFVIGNV